MSNIVCSEVIFSLGLPTLSPSLLSRSSILSQSENNTGGHTSTGGVQGMVQVGGGRAIVAMHCLTWRTMITHLSVCQ